MNNIDSLEDQIEKELSELQQIQSLLNKFQNTGGEVFPKKITSEDPFLYLERKSQNLNMSMSSYKDSTQTSPTQMKAKPIDRSNNLSYSKKNGRGEVQNKNKITEGSQSRSEASRSRDISSHSKKKQKEHSREAKNPKFYEMGFKIPPNSIIKPEKKLSVSKEKYAKSDIKSTIVRKSGKCDLKENKIQNGNNTDRNSKHHDELRHTADLIFGNPKTDQKLKTRNSEIREERTNSRGRLHVPKRPHDVPSDTKINMSLKTDTKGSKSPRDQFASRDSKKLGTSRYILRTVNSKDSRSQSKAKSAISESNKSRNSSANSRLPAQIKEKPLKARDQKDQHSVEEKSFINDSNIMKMRKKLGLDDSNDDIKLNQLKTEQKSFVLSVVCRFFVLKYQEADLSLVRKHSQQETKPPAKKDGNRHAKQTIKSRNKMEETASFNLLMDDDFQGHHHLRFDGENLDSFDSHNQGQVSNSDDLRARRPQFYKDRVVITEQELRRTIPEFILPKNAKDKTGISGNLDNPPSQENGFNQQPGEEELELDDVSLQKLGKEQYSKLCEKFRRARKSDMTIDDRINLMLLEKENKLVLREILKRATKNDEMEKELRNCTFQPHLVAKLKSTEGVLGERELNLNFEQRQQEFDYRKRKHAQQLKAIEDIEQLQTCPFWPKIAEPNNEILVKYPQELTNSHFLQTGLATHYDRMNKARQHHQNKQATMTRGTPIKNSVNASLPTASKQRHSGRQMSRSRSRSRSLTASDYQGFNQTQKEIAQIYTNALPSKSGTKPPKENDFEKAKEELRRCLLDI